MGTRTKNESKYNERPGSFEPWTPGQPSPRTAHLARYPYPTRLQIALPCQMPATKVLCVQTL